MINRQILTLGCLTVFCFTGAWGQTPETKRTLTPAQEGELKQAEALSQEVIALFQKQAYRDAIPLAKQAFEIQLRILDENDPATQTAMSDLAMLLKLNQEHGTALPYFERMLKWRRPAFGEKSPEVAETLNDLGVCHYQLSRFEPAYENFKAALQIREALFGKANESTITSLNNTGRALQMLGRYEEARNHFEQVLSVFQQELGAEHARTASALNDVGLMYKLSGNASEARKFYEQALTIRKKALGDDNPDTGVSQSNLGLLLQEEGEFNAALPLMEAALGNAIKHSGNRSLSASTCYANLAMLHQMMQHWEVAQQNYDKAYEIVRELKGDKSIETATIANNIGFLHFTKGDFQKAKSYFEQALSIRIEFLGDTHPDTVTSYSNLGATQAELGDHVAGRATLAKAQAAIEKKLGLKHPLRLLVLNNLAKIFQTEGKLIEARQAYQEVLDTRRKVLGESHPATADAEVNLGNILIALGDPEKGADHLLQAYERYQKIYGENHAKTALVLNNMASFLSDAGRLKEAKSTHQRVLAIRKATLGDFNHETALSLNNLATVEFDLGNAQAAIDYQQQALEIQRKVYGETHVSVAHSLGNLAYFMSRDPKNDSKAVDKAFLSAIEMQEKVLVANHPDLVTIYSNYALFQVTQRQFSKALETFDQTRRIVLEGMRTVLPSLSESEQLSFLLNNQQLSAPLTLGVAHRDDQAFVDRSAEWLLNAKGLSHAALALQTQRASAVAKTGSDSTKKSSLEAQLPEWTELSSVRQKLEQNQLLIEFITYDDFDFNENELAKRWKPARYAVWVIPPKGKGDTKLIDLGLKQEIDEQITKTRKTITDIPAIRSQGDEEATKTAIQELRKLTQRLLAPIQKELVRADRLVISPDSNLWLVPWSALVLDESERYLIEDKAIQLLICGRDLVVDKAGSTANKPAALFANPQYDLAPQSVWEAIRAVLRQQAPKDEDRQRSANFSTPGTLPKVERLEASALEADLIAPSLKTLTGQEPLRYQDQYALEQVVKALSKPRVLLISTHGFYLDDDKVSRLLKAPSGTAAPNNSKSDVTAMDNPLLRCGLMFAGCNDPKAGQATGGDDGVLTGMEIVGLDLRGTELVVLSACETGIGEVRNGQGVAGLRQAFQLAGAKTIVATLWSIPDRDSALVVNAFFEKIADRQSKDEALRQAQLERIEKRRTRYGAAHPFYWAAFSITE